MQGQLVLTVLLMETVCTVLNLVNIQRPYLIVSHSATAVIMQTLMESIQMLQAVRGLCHWFLIVAVITMEIQG